MFIYKWLKKKYSNSNIVDTINLMSNDESNKNDYINTIPNYESDRSERSDISGKIDLLISTNSTKSTSTNSFEMYIICDKNGIINDISQSVIQILFYDKNELIGNSVCILMNKLNAYLHNKCYFLRYHQTSDLCNNAIRYKLKQPRDTIIYNKYNRPLYVLFTVEKYNDNSTIITILNNKSNIDNNMFLYLHKIGLKNRDFIKSSNNIIIIMIDFINSTQILVNEGITNTINIQSSFYEDVIHLLKNYFYPYIYIHEILGDSYVFVINAEWTNTITEYCTSIAFDFVNRLYNSTKYYINFRTGITYGKIHYGIIDNHFRFFGENINLSSRLCNICEIGKIVTDTSFYDKLLDESLIEITSNIIVCRPKGFGLVNCYSIYLMDDMAIHYLDQYIQRLS